MVEYHKTDIREEKVPIPLSGTCRICRHKCHAGRMICPIDPYDTYYLANNPYDARRGATKHTRMDTCVECQCEYCRGIEQQYKEKRYRMMRMELRRIGHSSNIHQCSCSKCRRNKTVQASHVCDEAYRVALAYDSREVMPIEISDIHAGSILANSIVGKLRAPSMPLSKRRN